jgi:quercetin dioxygenase-like cupin family protein
MNEDQRTPPRDRFAGTEHMFDLTAEADRLRAESQEARDGHRQITLFRGNGISIVLFDFDADGVLKDHAADGYVTVLVLTGAIRVTTAGQEYSMEAGSLLVLAPGISHDLRAETPSRVLLTVRLDPAQDERT